MKVSNFLIPAGSEEAKELCNESGISVTDIIPYSDYYRLASFDPDVEKKRLSDLLAFSKELHEFIWTKAKISEEDKPLLVSGTLIALMNVTFMKTFNALPAEEVQDAWLDAIKKELDKADIPQAKKDTMRQPYSAIAVHPNLGKPDSKTDKKNIQTEYLRKSLHAFAITSGHSLMFITILMLLGNSMANF